MKSIPAVMCRTKSGLTSKQTPSGPERRWQEDALPLLCVNPSVWRRHICCSAHPDQENGTTPTGLAYSKHSPGSCRWRVTKDCLTHRSVRVHARAREQLKHQRRCPSCSSTLQLFQIRIFIKLFSSCRIPLVLFVPPPRRCRLTLRRSDAAAGGKTSSWTEQEAHCCWAHGPQPGCGGLFHSFQRPLIGKTAERITRQNLLAFCFSRGATKKGSPVGWPPLKI